MSKICNLWFNGKDGSDYLFEVFPRDQAFNPVSAVYAFLTEPDGNGKVLYIGQTENLKTRFYDHHKWDEAICRGFKYIAVYQCSLLMLDYVERNLIQEYDPPCNEQLCP